MPTLVIFCLMLILVFILYISFYCLSPQENLILSNLPASDIYIHTHHNQMFIGDLSHNKIGYIVTYHTQKPEKDMPKWKKKLQGKFVMVLDGEPNPLKDIQADAIVTTKADPDVPPDTKHVFLSYFVYSFKQIGMEPTVLIKKPNETITPKSKFCCFMYSNCEERYLGVVKRKQFYFKMREKFPGRVDNLGRCYNKTYSKNGWWQNNVDIYGNYKFVISFENQPIDGYISEKLWVPMVKRSIPIYYGAPDIKNYFNPKSFIHVNDFASFEDCIEYVKKVDADDSLYQSILDEPYFYNNEIDMKLFSYHYGGEFYHNLKKMLPPSMNKYIRPCQYFSENIHFVSYSATDKNPSIIKEAKHTGFFNKVQNLYSFSLPNPALFEKTIEIIGNNEIIVLIDASLKILSNTSASECYHNFYELLINDNKDMIVFYNQKKQLDYKAVIFRKTNKMTYWVNDWKSRYNQLVDIHTFLNVWNHQLQSPSSLNIVESSDFLKCFSLEIKN